MEKLKAKCYQKDGKETEIEIDTIKLFISYDKNIGDYSPENLMLLETKMLSPKYWFKSTGVSSKNLLDWKKNGILLDFIIDKKGWTKLNFVEFIWLMIVKELREFGLDLATIRKIKDELIYPSDLHEQNLKKHSVDELKKCDDTGDYTEDKFQGMSNLFVFQSTSAHFMNIMQEAIIERINAQLIIFNGGDSYYYEEGEQQLFKRYNYGNANEKYVKETSLDKEQLRYKSHICISLTEIIRNYTLQEKESLELFELGIMSKQELAIIEQLRRDDVTQISIRYKNKKINLMEVTEENKKIDVASRLYEHIQKNAYQDITVASENGSATYTRKTKIKL